MTFCRHTYYRSFHRRLRPAWWPPAVLGLLERSQCGPVSYPQGTGSCRERVLYCRSPHFHLALARSPKDSNPSVPCTCSVGTLNGVLRLPHYLLSGPMFRTMHRKTLTGRSSRCHDDFGRNVDCLHVVAGGICKLQP
jgi:hypothetical protein